MYKLEIKYKIIFTSVNNLINESMPVFSILVLVSVYMCVYLCVCLCVCVCVCVCIDAQSSTILVGNSWKIKNIRKKLLPEVLVDRDIKTSGNTQETNMHSNVDIILLLSRLN